MHLSFARILEYNKCPDSPITGKFAEGEDLLKTRMMPYCGRIDDDFSGYKLVAYCERDAYRDKTPYEIRGVINAEGKILRMTCSCEKQSTGQCEHVFATLIYCNRNDLDRLHRVSNKEVEFMQIADFAPKPLLEYECFKKHGKSKKRPRATEDQSRAVKQMLYGRDFETVIIKEEPE